MAKTPDKSENQVRSKVDNIKQVDSVLQSLLNDNSSDMTGMSRDSELNNIFTSFDKMIREDSYRVMRNKSASQSTYDYLASTLIADRGTPQFGKGETKTKMEQDAFRKAQLEQIFSATDMNATSMFLTGSSDVFHICDEVEAVCSYMYQLDEAINVLRDNILSCEQSLKDYPYEITFEGVDKSSEYAKIVKDALNDTRFAHLLNNHLTPKTIKFGRYYHMIIPYKEIGTKMLTAKYNNTHTIFNIPLYENYVEESAVNENAIDVSGLSSVLEGLTTIVEDFSKSDSYDISAFGTSEEYMNTIKYNIENLTASDTDTPPNILGITESVFDGMSDDLKPYVDKAIAETRKKFSANMKGFTNNVKDEDKHFSDSTIDPQRMEEIPGCYQKVLDPRVLVPIKLFDYVIGYYYFENYDYSRMGTTVTDTLTNQINFKQHNLIINNIVNSVLKNLKYGDIIEGSDDFRTLVLNCIFYAERLNNPIRIKFIPVEYVVEYKTNCDEDDNGQPVLLKSLIYARLYTSLLLFTISSIITKSTDTEFYYLTEGAISQSYNDQVTDIIEQFRNSNIDISQILSGNLLHGNRAINKRYFMPKGTNDQKLFDIDVVSGQQVDVHSDLLTDLKKMAIGSTGVPSVAIDYMDEVEFATIIKMTNTKTLTRCNNIQKDLNPSITESVKKIVKFNRPNAIPDDILDNMRCVLKPANTINNNISADELSNVSSTVDQMIQTWFKGQNTESPDDLNFIKEEAEKRLTMLMSTSLPWGELENMYNDVKIEAKRQKYENNLRANQGGSGSSDE